MYLNQCCWSGKIRAFLETNKDEWLAEMERRHHSASPFTLEPGNIKAWADSWDVLQDVFGKMEDPFLNLHIIFEYCLPCKVTENGPEPGSYVWPDALIVGRDTVVVLEFKNKPIPENKIPMFIKQPKKYRTRLQKYHDESRGMQKWGILVPTPATGMIYKPKSHVTACSPDYLPEVLRTMFGENPHARKTIKAWKNSTYSLHKKKKKM